jgi:nitrilase
LRARAIENEVFVIAANQVGPHPGGNHSGGRSLICDPWGEVLACAEEAEGFVVAELDLDRQADIRMRLPVLEHRRPEVYGAIA